MHGENRNKKRILIQMASMKNDETYEKKIKYSLDVISALNDNNNY